MTDVLLRPEVDPDALAPPPAPPQPRRRPAISRRWRRFGGGLLLVASVSTLLWWHHGVTRDPGLAFDAAAGFFRSTPGDVTGITTDRNALGTEIRVEFLRAGDTFMAFLGLSNAGPRSVRIEEVAPQGFYYWGFDGLALSENDHTAFAGQDYGPFHSFTLEAGQTRYVRLDFRLAGCDPAGLQDGYSIVDSLPVTYKVLGFRRTVHVPFDDAALSVHASGKCDHPLLPRR